MTTPPRPDVPVRTPDELTQRWADILEPPVFGARSLVLTWLDAEGRMLPVTVPVDDLPQVPDAGLLEGLRRVHIGIAESHLPEGGHFALALCRPGRSEVTRNDTAWAEALREALDGMPQPRWSLHLAAGGSVTPMTDWLA